MNDDDDVGDDDEQGEDEQNQGQHQQEDRRFLLVAVGDRGPFAAS